MNNLSINMKKLRLKKSISAVECSKSIGVTPSTWSNYEVGKSEPSIKTLIAIANLFQVSLDELIIGTDAFRCSESDVRKIVQEELQKLNK